MTGQLEEEKMQVYVRLGIRLLYKGAKSKMEGNRGTHAPIPSRRLDWGLTCSRTVRNLLKSMSVKQGVKYDAPESAKDIPAFIEFHKLDTEEILEPLHSFKNFNEFFYRCVCSHCRQIQHSSSTFDISQETQTRGSAC
jgi:phosphatidylserine decarboxylase